MRMTSSELRTLREDLGMTLTELAAYLGLSKKEQTHELERQKRNRSGLAPKIKIIMLILTDYYNAEKSLPDYEALSMRYLTFDVEKLA